TFDVVAWADGIVKDIVRSGSGNFQVRIRDGENNGNACLYLHLSPAPNLSEGQTVRKGDAIGKVSNHSNTSIHLHVQCTANHPDLRRTVNLPIYTSLIAAYRRDWRLPDMIESGALMRDPEREVGDGGDQGGGVGCSEPLAAALA